jgi:dimethylaniline monooxygenase (N-oxide forming) / hypotaurine monooxygenase
MKRIPSSRPSAKPRVAVIGAGACGLTTAKCLLDEDLEPVVFEQTKAIGGVWTYDEARDDGGSLAYRSLRTNTSKHLLAFSDYPFPDATADFPERADVLAYLHDYADHFQLRKHIRLNSVVEAAVRTETGHWQLTVRAADGQLLKDQFDALVVCSGLYRQPSIPTYSGIETYPGILTHSATYKGPERFVGQTVLVMGTGSSGVDIAAELGHVAAHVHLSTRSGAWLLPRYIGDRPYDHQLTRLSTWVPYWLRIRLFRHLVVQAYRGMGIADQIWRPIVPDFDLWRSRLTVGSELLLQIVAGRVTAHPDVAKVEDTQVIFEDGTRAQVDTIICCTGYTLSFPFLNETIVKPVGDTIGLYQHVFHPAIPNLAFIGLCIVNGPLFPVAELQARWVARVLAGKVSLPAPASMHRQIHEQRRAATRHGAHPLRVQLLDYMDLLAKQIGVAPKLLRHPRLIVPLLAGPLVAAQYRLDGPGQWEQAGAYIRKVGAPGRAPSRG